ncbi:MAG: Abi family protein, partial [Peptostreptococcaceae bacterium]
EHGYVPLWVLMNVLSFGTISLFYRHMKQCDKQKIAKEYKVPDSDLEVVLKVISLVRNLCAHSERLYNFKSKDTIRENWVHKSIDLERNNQGYINGRNDLYAVLICIRLFIDKKEMKSMTLEIRKQLDILEKQLNVVALDGVLKEMGFPKNWMDISKI